MAEEQGFDPDSVAGAVDGGGDVMDDWAAAMAEQEVAESAASSAAEAKSASGLFQDFSGAAAPQAGRKTWT